MKNVFEKCGRDLSENGKRLDQIRSIFERLQLEGHLPLAAHAGKMLGVFEATREVALQYFAVVLANDSEQYQHRHREAQTEDADTDDFVRSAAVTQRALSLIQAIAQPLTAIELNAASIRRRLEQQPIEDYADIYEASEAIVADSRRVLLIIQTLQTLMQEAPVEVPAVDVNQASKNIPRYMKPKRTATA